MVEILAFFASFSGKSDSKLFSQNQENEMLDFLVCS